MESQNCRQVLISFLFLSFYLICCEAQQQTQYNDNLNTNPYWHRELLDTRGRYYVEWLVDWNQQSITFNVTCATRGYVGFGLARDSKMEGADLIIGGIHPNGTTYFTDRHAIGQQQPIIDQQQNWILHSAQENNTHTILTFSRAFDTCDQNDIVINDDVLYLIWAYGETDNDTIYHYENRGSFLAYLRDPDLTPRTIHESNQLSRITGQQPSQPARVNGTEIWTISEQFQIPQKPTTYWCTVKKFSPVVPGKKHMIGYNVRLNPVAEKHLHHFILYRCVAPLGINPAIIFEPFLKHPGQEGYDPRQPLGPIPTILCIQFKIGYGIGGRPLFYPDNVGFPLGETNPEEYFIIQAHYDNPNSLPNLVSDIQMDIYYTDNLRENDGGILVVGYNVPGLAGILVPPGEQSHRIDGHCSQACTRSILPTDGIKLVGGLLHAHLATIRMRVNHFRNGRELPWLENDDNYKFNNQNTRIFREERTLMPGDQLSVQCRYDTTKRNKTTVGSYPTDQEMCTVFLLHYQNLEQYPQCLSELDNREYMMKYLAGTSEITWSNERIEYVAKSPPHVAGMTISEISDSSYINWNISLRGQLQRDHLVIPQRTISPSLTEMMKELVLGIGPPPEYATFPFEVPEYVPPQMCGLNG